MDYQEFLSRKHIRAAHCGFDVDPGTLPDALFDWQRAIVAWALKRGRTALFEDCGLGKTFQELAWAQAITRHTGGKVLIVAPLAVGPQMVREGQRFGVEAKQSRTGDDVSCPITITNYEMIDHYSPDDFVGVVLDECFPPDQTVQVLGLDNQVKDDYIANVKVGDTIFNASGFDNVKQTYKRRIDRAVYISVDGRNITCSENHPFFTVHGWKCAQDLCPGDYVMETGAAVRLVRDGVLPEVSGDEDAAFLRDILLCEMADEHAGTQSESTQYGSSGETRQEHKRMVARGFSGGIGANGENIELESDAECGNEGESIQYIAEDGAQTFRAWGKWARFDGPADDFKGCTVKRLDNGICFVTGPTHSGLSNRLQARLGELRKKNKHRSGRAVALQPEGCGCEEGRKAGFARVDSVEILEQGHPGLEKYRDADGLVYFYDIKATRHPSFSVNGLLVHNSSILKAFMGKTKRKLIDMWERTPYRLAATATPAPNDHTELGNHSEFLGLYSLQEMQSRWFVNDGFDAGCYRLKGHAERDFWEWCASWAVAIQNPADIGYDGSAYHLPDLETIQHIVASDESAYEKGMLLDIDAISATGIHKELRKSVESRSAELADIVNATTDTWVVWCQTDYEADELVRRIPDAIEVRGSMPYDKKADLLDRFSLGQERVIITKPRIAGWGLCWHHCSHMATVSPTYSFESRYQTVRRLWRFGQVNKVEDHVFMTRREASIFDQANRKQTRHNTMADAIRKFGHELSVANRRELKIYNPEKQIVLPSFLKGA